MLIEQIIKFQLRGPVRGGFRGGWGGCIPPYQPKSNDFGRKISLYFEKLGSISGCTPPPTSVKLTVSAEKSLSISVKTFFLFFFGDHLILGGKNVRISDFGPKITLNFGEDIRIFEGLCLKSPPTKIFYIRHWVPCHLVVRVMLKLIIFTKQKSPRQSFA